ncbi:hypothetical protein AB0N21_41175 [Streptomyces sp. NPDC051080]|uniref:hypothetical protein n=1 Tax=Streptomyces sp. NPDC051080 TaxID=3157222 RepID=UPI003417A4D1
MSRGTDLLDRVLLRVMVAAVNAGVRVDEVARVTGEPARCYERARPGELVHIDVKKLGRIPDSGGHKAPRP